MVGRMPRGLIEAKWKGFHQVILASLTAVKINSWIHLLRGKPALPGYHIPPEETGTSEPAEDLLKVPF